MSLDYQDPTRRRQPEFSSTVLPRSRPPSGSGRETGLQPPESMADAWDDSEHSTIRTSAPKLTKGLKGFFELLWRSPVGAQVSQDELRAATGWTEKSLRTYESKNKLSPFLLRESKGHFRVVRGGQTLQEADVANALSQVTTELLQLVPGEVLQTKADTYTLLRRRGMGAVGHVWVASTSTGSEVALKIVNPRPDLLDRTIFADVKRRFEREAKNGQKLAHEALVRILDHGKHRRHPFLVMELAEQSLRDRLQAGRLSTRESGFVVSRCASALRYLHDKGCIHRDVKPENMLQCARGFALGDLGIVRWDDLSSAFTSAGTITHGAVQLGSWFYMAPEQVENPHNITTCSDVYALGVTWYEMLSGRLPPPQAFAAGRASQPCTVSVINQLVIRMTAYDPFERPTIDEVLGVCEQYST